MVRVTINNICVLCIIIFVLSHNRLSNVPNGPSFKFLVENGKSSVETYYVINIHAHVLLFIMQSILWMSSN